MKCLVARMHDSFFTINGDRELPANAIQRLDDIGFVVISGSLGSEKLDKLSQAYDVAVASASSDDIHVGRTTTRINDFVNKGSEFDELYVCEALLNACRYVFRGPFILSSMLARTVHPNAQAQELHVDFKPDEKRFPLVSFIWMVDAFRSDNGATRFVPGSHKWPAVPHESTAEYKNQAVKACGPAGSLIIFDGSVLHEHSENTSGAPRRSIQGAFIPRGARAGTDFLTHMRPETLTRISSLARYVLDV